MFQVLIKWFMLIISQIMEKKNAKTAIFYLFFEIGVDKMIFERYHKCIKRYLKKIL